MISDQSSAPLLRGILDHESEPVSQILAAAESCFWGKGYHGTSIREIADAANVSKSLLHYHFQSKEHIFLEVQISVYNRLAARVTEAVSGIGDTTERGLFALDVLFDALRSTGDLQVQSELWTRSLTNPAAGEQAIRLREYLRQTVIETLDHILGHAWTRLPLTKEVSADLLLATLMGLGIPTGPDSVERAEAAFQGIRSLVEVALKTAEQ